MAKRICFALLFAGVALRAEPAIPENRFENLTKPATKIDGYLPLYWDEHTGKMWLAIDRFNHEFLYITALSAGVGSNDLGLDRGRMSEPKVVQFERSGPRVLLVETNYGFRASAASAAEKRAAADSFARSVLWGFEVAAENGSQVLVDATAFTRLLLPCPSRDTSLACKIRAPVSFRSSLWISLRRSTSQSPSATLRGTGLRRKIVAHP